MTDLQFPDLLAKIDELFAILQSKRPLNSGELNELRKSLKVSFTYHSNAIEGNTLTHGETKIVLEDGLTIAGKTVREISEALNHNAVFEWLYDMVDGNKPITEESVLALHSLILKNIDDENAGRYRSIQVQLSGDEKLPPVATKVPALMEELFTWYGNSIDTLHPVELAAELHYRFVKIHPFIDGNGRTIRVLINIHLMQRGYPIVILPVVRRSEYISALHSSSSREKFLLLFADIVHENMKDYLRMIDSEAT